VAELWDWVWQRHHNELSARTRVADGDRTLGKLLLTLVVPVALGLTAWRSGGGR
jgi:hypothetical protein